jgi:pimeloyl-ACP methyl ester carboxylesterase
LSAAPAATPAPAAAGRLPPALVGERFEFDSPAGQLSCYRAGLGPPLLLVHSVNAAASAAEVRPVFGHAAARRTVYALDLPGYGFSERGDRDYTPRLMTDALLATAAQIARRHPASPGPAPLDALALSLSCEFLARAAAERPALWGRLALVSPTGFNGTKPRRGPPGSTREVAWLYRLLSRPLWADALFRGLTRPGVVRYFLQRTWGGKTIDEALWRYCCTTARQPGARFAPLAFLGARLFSADISDVYDALPQPVWVSHGTRGDFTDYRGLKRMLERPNWQAQVYEGGALPYFEHPVEFGAAFDAFLAR